MTDATAVDVGPRVDPTIKSLASCIQEILNLPVGAQAHDRDFCAILQALGLDMWPAVGVVAPGLTHQIPIELFRASFGQVGPCPALRRRRIKIQSVQASAPMRHTLLCLTVAFLAGIACFFLTPIIGLLLLLIFIPRLFDDDTLGWMLAFGGPFLIAGLLAITITVGCFAFLVAKASSSSC
jgi:hypothetical protein